MTIEMTDWSMTSDRTPEYAWRTTGDGVAQWRLSWLPGQRLSHLQARAGMQLDELLSDPAAVQVEDTYLELADYATTLGVRYERAVILLSRRMIERLRRHSGVRTRREAEPVLSGRIPRRR